MQSLGNLGDLDVHVDELGQVEVDRDSIKVEHSVDNVRKHPGLLGLEQVGDRVRHVEKFALQQCFLPSLPSAKRMMSLFLHPSFRLQQRIFGESA